MTVANEIQVLTWCDVHLQEKDEHVPGTEYALTVGTAGGKGQPVVVDLCADCVGPLQTVLELTAAYGRKPAADGTVTTPRKYKRRQSTAAPAAAPAAASAEGDATCKLCGSTLIHRRALASHTTRVHRQILAEVEGHIQGSTCLLCEPHKVLKSPMAAAIHVGRGSHDVD